MTIDIQTLIEQRPHLKNPLELYAKWQRFHQEANELLPKVRSAMSPEDSKAYPRDSAGLVCQLFVSIFDLPGEEFEPLARRWRNGDIDFMRLPLDEIPALSSSLLRKRNLPRSCSCSPGRTFWHCGRPSLWTAASGRTDVVPSARRGQRSHRSWKDQNAACTVLSAAPPAHRQIHRLSELRNRGCGKAQHHHV